MLHHDKNGWQTQTVFMFLTSRYEHFAYKSKIYTYAMRIGASYKEHDFVLSKSVMCLANCHTPEKYLHSRMSANINEISWFCMSLKMILFVYVFKKCPDLLFWIEDGVAFVFSVSVGNLGPVRLSRVFRPITILAYELFDKSDRTVNKNMIFLCQDNLSAVSPTSLSWRSWR